MLSDGYNMDIVSNDNTLHIMNDCDLCNVMFQVVSTVTKFAT